MQYEERLSELYRKMEDDINDYNMNKHLYKMRPLEYNKNMIVLSRGTHIISDHGVSLLGYLFSLFTGNSYKYKLFYKQSQIYKKHNIS